MIHSDSIRSDDSLEYQCQYIRAKASYISVKIGHLQNEETRG